jgi:tetratricopeptide (TPR) repeat protein
MALAYFAAGRYELALIWADRSLAAQPDYRPAVRMKASCCAHLDRREEARDWVKRALELEPGLTIARWQASLKHMMPQEVLARHVEGLRKAGLPEE